VPRGTTVPTLKKRYVICPDFVFDLSVHNHVGHLWEVTTLARRRPSVMSGLFSLRCQSQKSLLLNFAIIRLALARVQSWTGSVMVHIQADQDVLALRTRTRL
jgi:hypothetical protein